MLVQAAVDEGALRDDIPPDLISRLLFGMVNSLVEWYRPGGPVDPDDARRRDRHAGVRRALAARELARLMAIGQASGISPRSSKTFFAANVALRARGKPQ